MNYKIIATIVRVSPSISLAVANFREVMQADNLSSICSCLDKNPKLVNATLREGDDAPLHTAVRNGSYLLVKKLLQYKADVNIEDLTKVTPLHLSSSFGYSSITKLLLDNEANPTAQDIWGQTPLDLAKKATNSERELEYQKITAMLSKPRETKDISSPFEQIYLDSERQKIDSEYVRSPIEIPEKLEKITQYLIFDFSNEALQKIAQATEAVLCLPETKDINEPYIEKICQMMVSKLNFDDYKGQVFSEEQKSEKIKSEIRNIFNNYVLYQRDKMINARKKDIFEKLEEKLSEFSKETPDIFNGRLEAVTSFFYKSTIDSISRNYPIYFRDKYFKVFETYLEPPIRHAIQSTQGF